MRKEELGTRFSGESRQFRVVRIVIRCSSRNAHGCFLTDAVATVVSIERETSKNPLLLPSDRNDVVAL
jgi:hypothetical protein